MLQKRQRKKQITSEKLKNFATYTVSNFVTSKNCIFATWKQIDRKK